MNTNTMRNALLISIAVVLAMIVIVMLLSIGEANTVKRTLTFLFVLGPIAYLILLWMRTLHLMRSDSSTASVESPQNDPVDDGTKIIFHTGQVCEIPGTYRCTQHESREVTMSEGKRFPPCQGDGKGHSADWMRI